MTGKYELVESDNKARGPYRVRALRDFARVEKGELGGYVHNETNLSDDGDCWIADNASVSYGCYISGNAFVANNATLTEDCCITGDAVAYGDAHLNHVMMYDNTRVSGDAHVSNSTLLDNAFIGGSAVVNQASLARDVRIVAGVIGGKEGYGHLTVHNGLRVSHADVCIETLDHQIVIETIYGPLCIVRAVHKGSVGYRMTVGCQNPSFESLIAKARRNQPDSYTLLAAGLQAWVEPVLRSWGIEGDLNMAGFGDDDDDDEEDDDDF